MRRWCSLVARCRRGDERGFAMLSVILLIVIVAGLTTVAVAAAVRNTHGSGLSRAKLQAADAAEAGINAVYATLQTSSGTGVPCTGAVAGALASGASYTTEIKYYSVYPPPPGATPIACTDSGLASAPAAAVITSIATPSQAFAASGALGTRKAESLVKISVAPSSSNGFDQAVFSDASLEVTNSVNITSTSGLNAGMYTNGDFECNSSPTFGGSVVVQGSATLSNSCTIQGDLWTDGDINATARGPKISGALKSSHGSAALTSKLSIGKGVIVAGTCCGGKTPGLTDDGKTPPASWGTVSSGVTGMAAPPHVDLPRVTYNPTDWSGFNVVGWKSFIISNATANHAQSWANGMSGNCTGLAGASYSMNGGISTPSTPTIINALADCGSGGVGVQDITISLYADTAFFANAFSTSNDVVFKSGDGQPHNLWLIVPWTNGSATCAESGVPSSSFNINSGLSFDPTLNTLLYTPGGITESNGVSLTGQIYGCNVAGVLRNALNLSFKSIGVPGVHVGPAQTYNVDVVYQREVG